MLNSTNGSRIIEVAQGIFAILAGAFVNAHAVADKLEICAYGERVAVTGCGWEGRRASEDESDVGASLYRMRQRGVGLDERARWVVDLYLAPPRRFCAGTASPGVRRVSGTSGISVSASLRIPCRLFLVLKGISSTGNGGVLAGGPNGGGAKRPEYLSRIFLTRV